MIKDLGWWFYYSHYTECFCHIKKITTYKHDTRLLPAEIHALTFIDDYVRANSITGMLASGFLTTIGVCGFVSYKLGRDGHKGWMFFRIALGICTLLKINSIMDIGSHIGILISLPRVFDIIEKGIPEKGHIKLMTQDFFDEFYNPNSN